MAIFNRTGGAVLLCALAGGTTLHADVTAEQVWTAWQDRLASLGDGAFSAGDTQMSGGTLAVSDVTMTLTDPEATVTVDLGDLTFTEQGDGTVSVGLPVTSPITVEMDPTFGTPVIVNATLTQEGVSLIVSGTPEELSYDLSAARYVMAVDSVEGDGTDVAINAAEISISDVTGNYLMAGDTLQTINYALSAGIINVVLDMEEPGGAGMLQVLGTIDGLETEASAAIPEDLDQGPVEDALTEGLAVEARYAFGATSYAISFMDDSDQFDATASAAGGETSLALDADRVSFSGGALSPNVQVSTPELPFPVDISLDEYGFSFGMPLAATEAPEEVSLRVLLSNLAVNEELWSMIDPAGMLDHGPATLSVDITGMVALGHDLSDPSGVQQMMMADLPGELYSLNINDLTVRAAGAEAMASGNFTFDNDDLETFGGVPRPEGSAVLEVNGLNRLIDTLIQMGLIPEEQVMAPRMMMGMFLQTVGEDMLRSEMEVNAQGHVIVNGQRIQ